MALATADMIVTIAHYYTLIVYPPLLVLGVIGNSLICLVFTCFKLFRHHQCSFYLIVEAIANSILMMIVLPFRTTEYVFDYDPTELSVVWCKFREALVTFFSLLSFLMISLAAFDQYLSTHSYPQLRRMSTLKLAHRSTLISMIILALYSILFLIYFDVEKSMGCVIWSKKFTQFYSYVHFCIFSVLLPLTLPTLFATMAYMNVRRIVRRGMPIVRRRLDRQLTALVLTKVAFFLITTLPFVIIRIYRLNYLTSPTEVWRDAIEDLLFTITSSLYYINSSGTFYLFFSISKRFRQQTRHVFMKTLRRSLICKLTHPTIPSTNQINPTYDGMDLELTH